MTHSGENLDYVTFKLNGDLHKVDGRYSPDFTLNEYIRDVANIRGTKVMCKEGGCGACIVSVNAVSLTTNERKTFAVNSCLMSVYSCHGWDIWTVEGIGNSKIGYHEIQKQLAKYNGSQCGFCSPGWVMNMYSLLESEPKLTAAEIENSFASNICRCTGYRSIADAFKSFATDVNKNDIKDIEDVHEEKCEFKCMISQNCPKNSWCFIEQPDTNRIEIYGKGFKWYRAKTLNDVFSTMTNGDYRLVAGNTGHGVYTVNEYPKTIIDISNVLELKGYEVDMNLVLRAGMSLADMMDTFKNLSKENEDFSYLHQFWEHMDLVAHKAVRNVGTIGGNLFLKHSDPNFQSDLYLLFETVGGVITIAEGAGRSEIMSLVDFLKVNLNNKVIMNVLLPPLSNCCFVKTYKIMPRAQNAHAIVNAGFLFKFHHSSYILESLTIVFGGIASDFTHAYKTELTMIGKNPFSNETLEIALKTLWDEVNPEDMPPESSVAYRKMLSLSLYYKAILSLCPDDLINPIYRSGGYVLKRDVSKGSQDYDTDESLWPLNQPVPKLESLLQCSGEVVYSNSIPKGVNDVFGAFVTSDTTPGSIISGFDTTEAFKLEGVIAFYTAKDIPGNNTFTPKNIPLMAADEEILCSGKVMFNGQPVGIVVANREQTAYKAANLVNITYSYINNNKPLLTIQDVLNSSEKNTRVINNATIKPTQIGNDVKRVVKGNFRAEDQYHYYIEPQTCIAKPIENGMEIYTPTQWLDLSNVAISQCLNVPVNSINVIVRKVGGSYGGKITRSAQVSCAAALVAYLQRKTCRFVLPIRTNMRSIGKRLPIQNTFEAGVNQEGVIQYLKNTFYQDNGYSINEVIVPLTLNHIYSCYNRQSWEIEANTVLTDKPSNTWCRAPGSTEGVAMTEYIMEKIAFETGQDSTHVRIINMAETDSPLIDMIAQLKTDADYDERSKQVEEFNKRNRWKKRALKLMPLTYEVGYFGNYNSIVSIYHGDGSVLIIHGGIEMGQGLNTKVAQVCAFTLGVPMDKIRVESSTSYTSPNTMTTGASIGSECVSFATRKACEILLNRLDPIKRKGNLSWEQIITLAFEEEIDLQASYMYSATKGDVKPYAVYAVCILEVEVDILTGTHDVLRVDILEDVGRSLSPLIDVTQIEGAFIMGLGYWTSEKLVYDGTTGRLLTDRTWTYKPPGIKDIPADMRISFCKNTKNEFGVLQSKATGEPSLCLATIIIHALREALRKTRLDAGHSDEWFDIENPCTVENIFMAVEHKIEHFKLD